jgi:WD40 repeat protein
VDVRGPPTLTAAEWPLSFSGDREVVESASPLGERVVSPVNARATSCCASPDGAWVATASDQGHIVVTDRRAGRYRTSFRAHGAGIVCVKAASRHEVFTVASDGSAALWRLTGSIPKPICVLRGLPNYGSGLRSSNVSTQACMKPKPALQVLVARGHKAVSLALPLGKSTPLNPIDCSRRLFVDVHGQKIPRGHLNVEACASLPARRAALLGCEDGRVRVAA